VFEYITMIHLTFPCPRNSSNHISPKLQLYWKRPLSREVDCHWLVFHAQKLYGGIAFYVITRLQSYTLVRQFVSGFTSDCVHLRERLIAPLSNGDMLACTHTLCVGTRVHYPRYHVQKFLVRPNAICRSCLLLCIRIVALSWD